MLARALPIEPTLALVALLAIVRHPLAVALVHWAATLIVQPQILPRLDFSKGIPADHRTLVAVPAMLTDADEIDELVDALEVRFLANRDPNLAFALVTDFAMPRPRPPTATRRCVQRARAAIEALNERYTRPHGGCFLFHRPRRWNPREKLWMGTSASAASSRSSMPRCAATLGLFATVVGPGRSSSDRRRST